MKHIETLFLFILATMIAGVMIIVPIVGYVQDTTHYEGELFFNVMWCGLWFFVYVFILWILKENYKLTVGESIKESSTDGYKVQTFNVSSIEYFGSYYYIYTTLPIPVPIYRSAKQWDMECNGLSMLEVQSITGNIKVYEKTDNVIPGVAIEGFLSYNDHTV